MARLYEFRDFPHFLEIWALTTSVLRTEQDFRQVVTDYAARGGRARRGLPRRDLQPGRAGRPRRVRGRRSSPGTAMARRRRGETHGVRVALTPDIPRGYPIEAAELTVTHATGARRSRHRRHRPRRRPRTTTRRSRSAPIFARAKDGGLGSVPHAGETEGPASVRAALDDLGADRIRHGIGSIEDPGLLRELADRGIVLDVCPTSNVCTGVVRSLAEHPLPELLAAGVKCTINTDDPAMFGNDLGTEHAVALSLGASPRACYEAGVQGALCDDHTRARARQDRRRIRLVLRSQRRIRATLNLSLRPSKLTTPAPQHRQTSQRRGRRAGWGAPQDRQTHSDGAVGRSEKAVLRAGGRRASAIGRGVTSQLPPDRGSRGQVVVVGGGIAGLAAAFFLGTGVAVTVLEASARLGGKLPSSEVAGLGSTAGAEALLARRPEAIDLSTARSARPTSWSTRVPPRASMWTRGEFRPLPEGQFMGVPGDFASWNAAGILSAAAWPEPAQDAVLPVTARSARMLPWPATSAPGWAHEVVDRLVEPLLGGVYAGRADQLSCGPRCPLWRRRPKNHRSLTETVSALLGPGGRPGARRARSSPASAAASARLPLAAPPLAAAPSGRRDRDRRHRPRAAAGSRQAARLARRPDDAPEYARRRRGGARRCPRRPASPAARQPRRRPQPRPPSSPRSSTRAWPS